MDMIVAGAILLLTIIPTGNTQKKPLALQSSTPIVSEKPSTPPSSPTPTQKPKEVTTHKVESGETIDSIANDYYGSSKYWKLIWNDNDFIEDPRFIKAGMELKIRDGKPEAEDLNEKLAKIYEELISPSPTPSDTPTPTQEVKGVSTSQTPTPDRTPGPAGSFDEAYRQAGTRFGVPWEILYGIHMVETGLRDGAISSGYGTGAQGPMQFMPGTWAAYGIDGNGDGNIDINNAIDAIFGAANFLAKHGGVEGGLKAYGGDSQGMINAAKTRGYIQ